MYACKVREQTCKTTSSCDPACMVMAMYFARIAPESSCAARSFGGAGAAPVPAPVGGAAADGGDGAAAGGRAHA